jgi:oligoribonuclease NrnB/cAMP/cGMP phosphodiesterase (DHH superfamily)
MENLKEIVVLYHADCNDGLGAAYSAWKKFGDTASYIPCKDHNVLPEGLTQKEIYILDFGFTLELTQALIEANTSVKIIDHHKTAESVAKSFPGNIFDNIHSAAVLAWNYFHPDTVVPELLTYVEDNDLWRFTLPEHREFTVALNQYDKTFESWDALISDLENENNRINFIAKGSLLAKFEDKLVAHMMTRKERVLFEGHEVWAINTSEYNSILGNQLAKLNLAEGKTPIGIVYHHTDNKVKVSLRSIGETDVSTMALKYGGGGHQTAAAFTVANFADLPFSIVT